MTPRLGISLTAALALTLLSSTALAGGPHQGHRRQGFDQGGCNYYGCWTRGGGCNYYGCWKRGGGCNYYGCSDRGTCNYYGCP